MCIDSHMELGSPELLYYLICGICLYYCIGYSYHKLGNRFYENHSILFSINVSWQVSVWIISEEGTTLHEMIINFNMWLV